MSSTNSKLLLFANHLADSNNCFYFSAYFFLYFSTKWRTHTLKSENKRVYHRDSTMLKLELCLPWHYFINLIIKTLNAPILKRYSSTCAIFSIKSSHIIVKNSLMSNLFEKKSTHRNLEWRTEVHYPNYYCPLNMH